MKATRRRLRAHEGFTLIELMVVILIVGVLAAIALPSFLGQRAKAQDGAAKSDARSMVSAMEACYTQIDRYDPCPDADPGVPQGTGPGKVEVTPSGDAYEVIAHSETGNTFTVTRHADSKVTRACSADGNARGGCVGVTW